MPGTLYLCATPIGNLEDITLRVIRLLKDCDLIAAEDTRHTLRLLNHLGIKKTLISYHEHNKEAKAQELISHLQAGKSIALVSDAGMPGLSDPGADMVALCRANGIEVTVAPGATAVVTALVLSELSVRRFSFEGFLPADKRQRRGLLEEISVEKRTMVFYEAPHHVCQTLTALVQAFGGQRQAACIRELTKRYEEVRKGDLNSLLEHYSQNDPRGEFVIVVAGADAVKQAQEERDFWLEKTVKEHMEFYTQNGIEQKDAMKRVAKDRGVSKRDIYHELLIQGKK